ncbi:MAG: alpha/beta hydrolase [Gemmataceae bacterium]|nr:alpha/beta hydrolase [Gemmataceae bacterium]
MSTNRKFMALALLLLTAGPTWAQTFTAKGVKIAYLNEGKGGPVVLVHGLFSSTFINWQLPGIVAELKKTHQVISLDLPGHGFSARPLDKEAYGIQMVDDVALLMDHLKIKKAHIVGYSLGGMITFKFMTKYPERVLSGTVCGMGWLQEGSLLQKFWDGAGKDIKLGPPPVMLESIQQLAVTEHHLKKIDLPVKVLIGSKDICKQLYVDPLRKVRKDWPVVEIKDADHLICIFNPQLRDEIAA